MSSEGFRRPGTWVTRVSIHHDASGITTWTNMPAAAAFVFGGTGNNVVLVNIDGMYRIRLLVNKRATPGVAGSKLIVRYSSTFSTAASDYIDIGTTEVSVDVDVSNVYLSSAWIAISSLAVDYGDVYMAVIGTGGDGVVDPSFGAIDIELQ